MVPQRAMSLLLLLSVALASSCDGCMQRLKERALKSNALAMCDTVPHRAGKDCRAAVERDFDRCAAPLFAQQTSARDFSLCLGFEVAVDTTVRSTVLGQCEAPDLVVALTVSMARRDPWPGSAPRDVEGRTLSVATAPVLGTSDLRSLQLEDQDGNASIVVELTENAARRFHEATTQNVGESAVIELNGTAMAVKLSAPIPGPRLVLPAHGQKLAALCRTR